MGSATSELTTSHWPATETTGVRDITLGDALREAATVAPDRAALVDGAAPAGSRRRWTYSELLTDAERLARALLTRHEPGERIGIDAPNCVEWVQLQYAAALAGLTLVPLNPAYRRGEVEVMLRMTRVTAVFHVEAHRDNDVGAVLRELRPVLPELRELILIADLDAYAAAGDDHPVSLPEVFPEDVSHVQFTSGTTGIPKGALIPFRAMVNNARFVAERTGFPEGGVWINAMPMFHSGGMSTSLGACLGRRGTFVLAPGFEAGQMLELFEGERGNTGLLVPTMLLAMLEHPSFPERDLRAITTLLSGATDVPAALVHRLKCEIGCDVSIMFGQSEACGVATATRPDDAVIDQAETVGRPMPNLEVKISGGDGQPVGLGEPGEICIRGYSVMRGYLDMPQETRETIDADGWLHTGDLGTMDERGFIRVTGRLKDVILRGGLNIYSREIENVLFEHPAIHQVSIVGVPDERLGEVVAAVVIFRDVPLVPEPAELVAFCRERLARHKSPALWFYVDAFPLTASGKVQKFVLREWIAGGTITATEGGRPRDGEGEASS